MPDRASVTYIDSPVVLGPLDSLLTPYAGSGVPGFPTIWLLVACVVGALVPRRRPLAMNRVSVTVVLLALSVAGIFLGWLGSPVEFARHALPFTLFVPLGLVLLLLTFVDALVPDRAARSDDGAEDDRTVEGSSTATGSAGPDPE